jgi:hypothetical protein
MSGTHFASVNDEEKSFFIDGRNVPQSTTSSARHYTTPHTSRPAKRCTNSSAKRPTPPSTSHCARPSTTLRTSSSAWPEKRCSALHPTLPLTTLSLSKNANRAMRLHMRPSTNPSAPQATKKFASLRMDPTSPPCATKCHMSTARMSQNMFLNKYPGCFALTSQEKSPDRQVLYYLVLMVNFQNVLSLNSHWKPMYFQMGNFIEKDS